jgi:hypothetical protein
MTYPVRVQHFMPGPATIVDNNNRGIASVTDPADAEIIAAALNERAAAMPAKPAWVSAPIGPHYRPPINPNWREWGINDEIGTRKLACLAERVASTANAQAGRAARAIEPAPTNPAARHKRAMEYSIDAKCLLSALMRLIEFADYIDEVECRVKDTDELALAARHFQHDYDAGTLAQAIADHRKRDAADEYNDYPQE